METPQAQTTPHILVIEDDPAVARSLQQALARERYRVSHRDNGQEGLAQALRARPQLIILDVRLPDMSGFDVCRELRRQGLHQPVLMLTVRGEEVDKVLGLEMGADDYMTKPFGLRELLSRVRALLRRAYGAFAATNADVHYVANLRIERRRGEVWRDDEPLALTPTEYRLLNTLVEHRGQALSRAQLLQSVWGHEATVESERTINVYIRRLREKIEPDPANPTLILTVPGIGYRFARES
jgi:DNA-binding response OmpR family regulator